ncbi:hypothetical protein FB451DRAFT_1224074 [Mycena latifolia]|nr:hypothetical protein FB451DRAFT_1224074 [Mycena latifolia]
MSCIITGSSSIFSMTLLMVSIILPAAGYGPPIEETTPDGYDLTFATNVLGHFYLTKLLLPTLIATADTRGAARIVTLTSMVHYVATVDYSSFKDGPTRLKRTPFDMYAQSKWAHPVFAMEVARRYADLGIVSTSVNPGICTFV